MSNASKIEWFEGGASWNPVTGCTPVHSGCANCYAKRFADRRMGPWRGRYFSDVQCHEDRLSLPLRWRTPRRVFVCSMGDLFHPLVPDGFICQVFDVMRSSHAGQHGHEFIILTKRPARMINVCGRLRFDSAGMGRTYLTERADERHDGYPLMPHLGATGLTNVTLGVSCSTQEQVDTFVPVLLQTPAANRIVSLEPLLGEVDMERGGFALHRPVTSPSGKHWPGLDGVIVGGESGPKARPCDIAWIRSIVRQCREAGVPCFVKQLGAQPIRNGIAERDRISREITGKGNDMAEWPEDLRVREWHR